MKNHNFTHIITLVWVVVSSLLITSCTSFLTEHVALAPGVTPTKAVLPVFEVTIGPTSPVLPAFVDGSTETPMPTSTTEEIIQMSPNDPPTPTVTPTETPYIEVTTQPLPTGEPPKEAKQGNWGAWVDPKSGSPETVFHFGYTGFLKVMVGGYGIVGLYYQLPDGSVVFENRMETFNWPTGIVETRKTFTQCGEYRFKGYDYSSNFYSNEVVFTVKCIHGLDTPVIPTSTNTPIPPTSTLVPPTLTVTPIPPTFTPIPLPTNTPVVPQVSNNMTSKLAFASDKDGNVEIYSINADGSDLKRLTNSPQLDGYPAWSPDGTRIAFVSERDGNPEIYVMNADGTNLTRLTADPAYDYQPSWSPDSRRIAFSSNRNSNTGIYIMSAYVSRDVPTKVVDSGSEPEWSPDGNYIAFVNQYKIYVLDVKTNQVTELVNDPNIAASEPSWLADSNQLSFADARQGKFFIVNLKTKAVTGVNLGYMADWSPDGQKVAFFKGMFSGLYIMNSDGTGEVKLTSDNKVAETGPDWSKGGTSQSSVPQSAPAPDAPQPQATTNNNALQTMDFGNDLHGAINSKADAWYTFTGRQGDTLIFFMYDPHVSLQDIGLVIYDQNNLPQWPPDNPDNLVNLGVGGAVSEDRDGDGGTGEMIWRGSLLGDTRYYVRFFNRSGATVKYCVTFKELFAASCFK